MKKLSAILIALVLSASSAYGQAWNGTTFRDGYPLNASDLNSALGALPLPGGSTAQGPLHMGSNLIDGLTSLGLASNDTPPSTPGSGGLFYVDANNVAHYLTSSGDLPFAGNGAHVTPNLMSYGAKMNGSTNDNSAVQAAYNATPSNGTILVPGGGWNVGSLSESAGKNVFWHLLGALDFGTSSAGTNPVTSIGDGDVEGGYYAGRYNFTKQLTSSSNGFSVLNVSVADNADTAFPSNAVVGALTVSGTMQNGGTGSIWPLASAVSNFGTHEGIAAGFSAFNYGSGIVNAYYGQCFGFRGASCALSEQDTFTNGPEPASTSYLPGGGHNVLLLLQGEANSPAAWAASTNYAVNAQIQGGGYTYLAAGACASGSSTPTWAASNVTDGTCTWDYVTTVATQVSRIIDITGTGNGSASEAGALILGHGAVYDAGFDLSGLTLDTATNANAAAIRIAPNQPIDFSATQTISGQNVRTLEYNSTAGALQYSKSGAPGFQVNDLGNIAVAGASTASGIEVNLAGSAVVGVNTSGATLTTALRMASGQLLTFIGTDTRSLSWTSTTTGLQYKVSGSQVWALSDAGVEQPAGGVQLPQTTVAALPTCNAAAKGTFYGVTDATAPTYNGTLTGGGAVAIPVYCNGTAWTAH